MYNRYHLCFIYYIWNCVTETLWDLVCFKLCMELALPWNIFSAITWNCVSDCGYIIINSVIITFWAWPTVSLTVDINCDIVIITYM